MYTNEEFVGFKRNRACLYCVINPVGAELLFHLHPLHIHITYEAEQGNVIFISCFADTQIQLPLVSIDGILFPRNNTYVRNQ